MKNPLILKCYLTFPLQRIVFEASASSCPDWKSVFLPLFLTIRPAVPLAVAVPSI